MNSTIIDSYMKLLKKKPLLTKDQEIELAKKIEKGDESAKKIMIESNLRLAFSIAKKYSKYGSSMEDLIQECNVGLIKAIEKFDWRKGYKFSTYGSWWIRQAATRYLTLNNTLLEIPSHTLALSRKIMQLKEEYYEEFKCEPSVAELSEILDVSEKQIKIALSSNTAKNIISIDLPVNDENSRTLSDILPDCEESLEDLIDAKIFKQKIIETFKTLNKREELVLRLRFGLADTLDTDQFIYDINEKEEQ